MMGSGDEDWSLDDDESAFLDAEEPADAIAVRILNHNFKPASVFHSDRFFSSDSSLGRISRRE